MQHIHVDTQLRLKQKTVLEQLQHFGKIIPDDITPPITGKTEGYRGKARLGVRFVIKKNKMLVGFREKSSRYLADIETCSVLDPRVGPHLLAIRELVSSLEQYDHIPQIEVAAGEFDIALVFRHLTPLPQTDIEKLIAFGQQHHFHVYLQPNLPDPLKKIWPADKNYRLSYSLPDHAISFRFHPLDFTQVNSEINQRMINQAIDWLSPSEEDNILDLFCGLGNFSLPLARLSKHVTGVEGSDDMVERAKENAILNQLANTNFYSANLMDEKIQAPWLSKKYNSILLDPPRLGAKEIIPSFKKMSAKKIVYVSCNPATLARDAGLLASLGYQLKKVGVINMFPHTSHIEAMALFEKK